ncbi:RES family NAD+ phosphorylase [Rhizobium leguminosarum]|uniref:RES domain-containing protein n=1 Tax=Rhizobium leguminosarum TaxID=384 RepID=A0A7K3VL60_RHILE|nr:RES family NAD+ phosphorylase [Rhizobium leguminosarum]NEK17457.1 RES domain-containing protein [Rhizobium leguminosarum]
MRLCPSCFDDRSLQRLIAAIRRDAPNEKCSFHGNLKGVEIREVGRLVSEVVQSNFDPGPYDDESDDFWQPGVEGRGLEEILQDITKSVSREVDRTLAEELVREERYWLDDDEYSFFSLGDTYVPTSAENFGHSALWKDFRRSVQHEQRFFNSSAKEAIAKIFDAVHLQKDSLGNPSVYKISPGESMSRFFRCRIANDPRVQTDIAKDPDKQLGPPPDRLRRPGRMNPAGIAALYGAYTMETCIAELRPPVGSTIAGAQFEFTRPTWVLDTTRFQRPGRQLSYFAAEHRKRSEQWTFMQRFRHEISQPVLPDDEYLDYIPTQAVAEYLCNHHEFPVRGGRGKIEAIIFNSAQSPENGRNIVLVGPSADPSAKQRPSTSFEDLFDTASVPKPAVRIVQGSVEFRVVRSSSIETTPADI